METPEVVVIGGGIIGCSIAYYLAKRGVRLTLVERNDLATGMTRAGQGGVGGGSEMTLASARLYSGLSQELDSDLKFTWKGGLNFIVQEKDLPPATAFVEERRRAGREATLLSRTELRELEPAAADDIIAAVFYADSGGVDAFRTTYSLARACAALGSRILLHTEATDIKVSRGRVRSVVTDSEEIATRTVVLATGVWAPELGAKMGLSIPVIPRRGHLLVTESTPALQSDLSVYQPYGVYAELRRLGERASESENPFVRQGVAWNMIRSAHDSYLIGTSRDFAGFDRSVRHDVARSLAQQAVRFFPCLSRVSCIRVYSGWRQYTPDVRPIMGLVDNVEGLILATGFEGEGIMLAPIVGKLLSELLVDGEPSMPLDEYRYSRFAEQTACVNTR